MTSTVKLSGDEKELVDSQQKVVDSAVEIEREYRKVSEESKKLERTAKAAFESTRTEAEKYRAKLDSLDQALQKGLISQEVHAKAVAKAGDQYDKASKSALDMFGESALSKVTSYATGILGVSAAVNFLFDSLRSAKEEARELADNLKSSAGSRGELLQGAGTVDELTKSLRDVRRLRSSGASTSLDEAQRSFAEIQSAGLQSELETFVAIGRSGVVQNIGSLASSIQSLQVALGKQETGGTEALVSKALTGGIVAQAKVDDILRAAASASASAKPLKLSDEEVITAVSLLTQPLAGPENARTALQAFLNQVNKQGLGGGSLTEIIGRINQRVSAGEKAIDVIGGDTNAIKGYQFLSDTSQVNDLLVKVRDANSGAPLRDRVRISTQVPIIAADIARKQAEGQAEITKEDYGILEGLKESAFKQYDAVLASSRNPLARNSLTRYLARSQNQFRDLLGYDLATESDIGYIESWRRDATRSGNTQQVVLLTSLLDTIKQMLDLQKKLAAGPRAAKIPQPESN